MVGYSFTNVSSTRSKKPVIQIPPETRKTIRDESASRGALILSYKRADRIYTIKALRSYGYTGSYFVVVSTDDPQLERYRELHRGRLIEFDRESVDCNYFDNLPPSNVLAARNVAWDIAEKIGWSHFVVLDDDYVSFETTMAWKILRGRPVSNRTLRSIPNLLDSIFSAFWEFLDTCPKLLCVTMCQSGDAPALILRKMMQTFFVRTDRRFEFIGRANEDVTTYYDLGLRGQLVLQTPLFMVRQCLTQKNPGGQTEFYLDYGTYFKTFYTVMRWPGCCQIKYVTWMNRYHHTIRQGYYVRILRRETCERLGID